MEAIEKLKQADVSLCKVQASLKSEFESGYSINSLEELERISGHWFNMGVAFNQYTSSKEKIDNAEEIAEKYKQISLF